MIETKNFSLTIDNSIIRLQNNEELSGDEKSAFIYFSYLYFNNLVQLHLNTFKSYNLNDLNSRNFTTIPCECVAKSWVFANKLMQNYDSNGCFTKVQQVKF